MMFVYIWLVPFSVFPALVAISGLVRHYRTDGPMLEKTWFRLGEVLSWAFPWFLFWPQLVKAMF